jgi:hypothetical protein
MKKLYFIILLLFLFGSISYSQIEDPKIEVPKKENRSKVIVYTKTGEIFKGYFISQNKDFIEIETESAGTLKIPANRIDKVESLDEENKKKTIQEDLSQVNPVRYMLGTSAFNYEKGRNYIRNNPMTFHRGVTDNFSFGVGTSLWALVLRVPIIYVNPQYTSQLGKNVRFKVGLDAFAAAALEEGGGAAATCIPPAAAAAPELTSLPMASALAAAAIASASARAASVAAARAAYAAIHALRCS